MKSDQQVRKMIAMCIWFLLYPLETFSKTYQISDELKQSLDYFYDLSDAQKNQTKAISLTHIKTLLTYVQTSKNDDSIYFQNSICNASGAYYDYELNAGLDRILRYAYNIDIPAHLFSPAAVRLSSWTEVDDQWKKLPSLIDTLPSLNHPILMRGVEYSITTPDIFSGAYYDYFVNRTIVLCRIEDQIVLISMSKQIQPSSIGRKGFVIGDDEEWNYFYSGEKGLTKSGLGWADTYMYNSFSISVQCQTLSSQRKTTCGIFSWVNAGWAGLNVVKSKHIHNGLKRYAHCFKEVLESPLLPKPDELIRISKEVNRMSVDELRNTVKDYYITLFNLLKKRGQLEYEDILSELLYKSDIYNQMTSDELRAFLLLEYLKQAIEKDGIKEKTILLGIQHVIFRKDG